MSVADDIEKARKEAEAKSVEAAKLTALSAIFPDLQKRVGRWNKVAYYSPSANAKVHDFDARHNCGCCSDSPLEIWPYFLTAHGPVYSDPPCFTVGERVPRYEGSENREDRPYDGWDRRMRAAGIPESIIQSVGNAYFGEAPELPGEESK